MIPGISNSTESRLKAQDFWGLVAVLPAGIRARPHETLPSLLPHPANGNSPGSRSVPWGRRVPSNRQRMAPAGPTFLSWFWRSGLAIVSCFSQREPVT
jgi:hypothetical protein